MDKINRDIASIILGYADYFRYGRFFDALYPGCRQQCYNINICEEKVVIDIHGYYAIEYRLFGKIHRENDLPAIEDCEGSKSWYYCDELHRDLKPAIEYKNGDHDWYYHGKIISLHNWKYYPNVSII